MDFVRGVWIWLGSVFDYLRPTLPQIAGMFGGFLIAVFAEPVRRLIWAPKLDVSFRDSEDFIAHTQERTKYYSPVAPLAPLVTNEWHEAIYLRFRVENTRRALAKSCRAYLVNVERRGPSGTFEATNYAESLQLAWASHEDAPFEALDLPKDVPHFVDVVSSRQTSEALQPSVRSWPARYQGVFSDPGEYRVTIVVCGDGVPPKRRRLLLSWPGTWDGLTGHGTD